MEHGGAILIGVRRVRSSGSGQNEPVRWRAVCKLAGQLPEVLHGRSYDTPVLYVRGSFLARLSDDRRSILVKTADGSTVAMRLATVDRQELWDALVAAWRQSAPPSLVAGVDPATLRL